MASPSRLGPEMMEDRDLKLLSQGIQSLPPCAVDRDPLADVHPDTATSRESKNDRKGDRMKREKKIDQPGHPSVPAIHAFYSSPISLSDHDQLLGKFVFVRS